MKEKQKIESNKIFSNLYLFNIFLQTGLFKDRSTKEITTNLFLLMRPILKYYNKIATISIHINRYNIIAEIKVDLPKSTYNGN